MPREKFMGLIEIISLIGGVAFFLYGMHVMSSGLAKLSGGKLEATLRKMTSSLLKSILLGAGITIGDKRIVHRPYSLCQRQR